MMAAQQRPERAADLICGRARRHAQDLARFGHVHGEADVTFGA